MSEGVRTPPNGGGFRFKVRAPRDFYGGLALIALAIIAIWTSGDLPGIAWLCLRTRHCASSVRRTAGGCWRAGGAHRPFFRRSANRELCDPRARLGAPGDPCLCRHDPRNQSRAVDHPTPWAGAVHLCRLHGFDLRFHRNALARKPDRCRGDDGVLRRAVCLSAAAPVPAVALGLSRKQS